MVPGPAIPCPGQASSPAQQHPVGVGPTASARQEDIAIDPLVHRARGLGIDRGRPLTAEHCAKKERAHLFRVSPVKNAQPRSFPLQLILDITCKLRTLHVDQVTNRPYSVIPYRLNHFTCVLQSTLKHVSLTASQHSGMKCLFLFRYFYLPSSLYRSLQTHISFTSSSHR